MCDNMLNSSVSIILKILHIMHIIPIILNRKLTQRLKSKRYIYLFVGNHLYDNIIFVLNYNIRAYIYVK